MGYNGNLRDRDLVASQTGPPFLSSRGFVNDSRQVFVKFSYLLGL